MVLKGKVGSVNPGMVVPLRGMWSFTIVVNDEILQSDFVGTTASGTKQAMREEVARLRKVHSV